MRDISFRGKRIDNGQWVYGGFYKEPTNDIKSGFSYIVTSSLTFAGNAHAVIPETVGEYSGFVDRNGRKIYEGDIVTREVIEGWTGEPKKGVISFDNSCFQWNGTQLLSYTYQEYDSHCQKQKEVYEYLVIGNIYDNSKLLEGK